MTTFKQAPQTTATKVSNQSDNGQSRKRAQKLAEFYRGKNIFITGTSGFIGKIVLLKLMSSLGDCGRVYVLLRPKKGLTPQQRFNKMLTEAPFNAQLMSDLPGKGIIETQTSSQQTSEEFLKIYQHRINRYKNIDWSRVSAIDGDVSKEDLGIDAEIKAEMCKSVNIVFNIAASVQFDAPLKQNLRDNYIGTNNMLNLTSQFENLCSLVHVSTFFANHHLKHVEEKVIPMQCDVEKMAELIQWLPDKTLEIIWPQICENRPNTYIFTKAMSENLVQKYQGRLPIAIVRPSIVVPSLSEPQPGWVDNVNGPMGLGVLASLGILRIIDWNYWGVCDFVPVDYVVNSMLAVAERIPREHPREIKVYNCSSSTLKPITWGHGFETLRVESLRAPPYKMLRNPIAVPKHKRASKLSMATAKFSELLFAYFLDFILLICGQKTLLTKLTKKLHHGYDILRPFTTNEYTCTNENLLLAQSELTKEDQNEFMFNFDEVDWTFGFRNAYYGARKLLLKEDSSNLQSALLKHKILVVFEQIFKITFASLIFYYTYKLYNQYTFQPTLAV